MEGSNGIFPKLKHQTTLYKANSLKDYGKRKKYLTEVLQFLDIIQTAENTF